MANGSNIFLSYILENMRKYKKENLEKIHSHKTQDNHQATNNILLQSNYHDMTV